MTQKCPDFLPKHPHSCCFLSEGGSGDYPTHARPLDFPGRQHCTKTGKGSWELERNLCSRNGFWNKQLVFLEQ